MRNIGLTLILFLVTCNAQAIGWEEDDLAAKGVYRGLNSQGMTGLFVTSSAYSLKRKQFEASMGAILERSTTGFSGNAYPIQFAYGLTNSFELGIGVAQIESSATGSGLSSVEVHSKWRFKEQAPDSPIAAAIAGTIIIPTGKNQLNEVNDWGVRLHAIVTSETNLDNGKYIGRYGELVLTTNDLMTSTVKTDSYYAVNAGLLYPLSDNRKLQVVLEGGSVFGRDVSYLGTTNYLSLLLGLRYSSVHTNLNGAVQVLNKENGPSGGTKRLFVSLGYQF